MQQVQDQLQFQIETPNDRELARRFADRQRELSELNSKMSTYQQQQNAKKDRDRWRVLSPALAASLVPIDKYPERGLSAEVVFSDEAQFISPKKMAFEKLKAAILKGDIKI